MLVGFFTFPEALFILVWPYRFFINSMSMDYNRFGFKIIKTVVIHTHWIPYLNVDIYSVEQFWADQNINLISTLFGWNS